MRTLITMKVRYLGLLLAVGIAAVGYAMGCGSSSATGDSTSTVNLTGTVQAPSSANLAAPIGKSLGAKAAPTEAAASGLTCTFYTLEGENLGTGTSGTDGTFTIAAKLATLQPDGAGATWTEEVKGECENSDGSIHVEIYAELTYTEGTTTFTVGTLNTDSTLAAAAVFKKLGCDPKAGTKCTPPTGIDLECIAKAELALVGQASSSGSGASDDMYGVKCAIQAAQAAGLKPADVDSTLADWGDITLALRDGTISAAGLAKVAATGSASCGTTEAALTAAAAKMEAMRVAVTDFLAGSAGLTEVTSGVGKPCDLIAADANYGKCAMQAILAEDDAAKMAKTYGSATAWQFLAGVCDKEKKAGGDWSALFGDGAAFDGYLENFNGDYSSFLDGGVIDPDDIAGLYDMMKGEVLATWTAAQMETYVDGMYNQLQASGSIEAMFGCTSGVCNAVKIGAVGAYFEPGSGYDPATAGTAYYTKVDNFVDNVNTGATEFSTCNAVTDLVARQSCYDNIASGGGSTQVTAGTYTLSGPMPSCVPGTSAPSSVVIANSTATDTPSTGSQLTGIGPGKLPISATSATVCSFTSCSGVGASCALSGSSIIFTSCQFGNTATDTCSLVTYTRP